MKNTRNFAKIVVFFLIIDAIIMTGCENPAGIDPNNNPSNGENGNNNDNNKNDSSGRVYFIKTAFQTESSGTLCFLPENSKTVFTYPGKNMTSFSVSNDNQLIVFAEILAGYSGTYIAFMNASGVNYHQTYISGSNPVFSADGKKIYFDDNGNIFSMNIDDDDINLIDIPQVIGTKRFPRISPNGEKLAFFQSSPGSKWYSDDVVYLYVCDLQSGEVIKLNNNSIPVSYLNWSPDGKTIAFSTTTGVTPPIHELWTVKADGSEQPVRIADSGSPAFGACGFPYFIDNDYILCASTKNKKLNWYSSWDGSHYMYELAKIKSDGTSINIILSGFSIKDPVVR